MGQPVVHFEIIGSDPATLRSYYGALFGWEFDTGDAATDAVSQASVGSAAWVPRARPEPWWSGSLPTQMGI